MIQLQSDISIRDSVEKIAQRQEEILNALHEKTSGDGDPPRRPGILGNSTVNAAGSTFTTVSGNYTTSAVHSSISNTNSGNVSTQNYTNYSSSPTLDTR